MELTNEQKRALLAPVKCFLLDMDGTFIWATGYCPAPSIFWTRCTGRDAPLDS